MGSNLDKESCRKLNLIDEVGNNQLDISLNTIFSFAVTNKEKDNEVSRVGSNWGQHFFSQKHR